MHSSECKRDLLKSFLIIVGKQMAIYHYHRQIGKRSKGKNAVFGVAYIRGEKMTCHAIGVTKDFSYKTDVIYKNCFLPEDAPTWAVNIRNAFHKDTHNQLVTDVSGGVFSEYAWNQIELIEKRADAQLYFHEDLAIPIELSQEQAISLMEDFVKKHIAVNGIFCDVAIHWDLMNPHAHIMMPLRKFTDEGFSNKLQFTRTEFSQNVKIIREQWAYSANAALKECGHDVRIAGPR
jgi:hypothetical protein